jgi:CAAX protease family protein
MNFSSANGSKGSVVTWLGLFVALFGLLIVRWAVTLFYPPLSAGGMAWKESLMWLCLIVLLFVIRRGEHLPLRSIKLGTASVGSSLLWGVIITLLCFMAGGAVARLVRFEGGPMAGAFAKLPLWFVLLIVVRAGVVEEVFYRGYAIERLQSLGLNQYVAGAVPLLIFGFAHGTNGWGNIAVALAVGAVLTVIYVWRAIW